MRNGRIESKDKFWIFLEKLTQFQKFYSAASVWMNQNSLLTPLKTTVDPPLKLHWNSGLDLWPKKHLSPALKNSSKTACVSSINAMSLEEEWKKWERERISILWKVHSLLYYQLKYHLCIKSCSSVPPQRMLKQAIT